MSYVGVEDITDEITQKIIKLRKRMNTYIVIYRDWGENYTKEFNCDDLLEFVNAFNQWLRKNCIYEDSIVSIEEQ